MLLGIVLHAAIVYIPGTGFWLVNDPETHAGFGLFVSAVHGFRMPLFFVISGFFTAMLWRKRGLRALLWQRFRRIFLPLVLAMVTIIPAMRAAGWYVRYASEQREIAAAALAAENGESKSTDASEKEEQLAVTPASENLGAAAHEGDVEAIRQHLADGADPDKIDKRYNSTPLSIASIMGHAEAVRVLLDAGADVNIRNGDQSIALHGAAFFGHAEVARLLLAAGADVNVKNVHRETPLGTTVHGWDVVEQIGRVVQYEPQEEQVTEGRKVVVALIQASPDWHPSRLTIRDAYEWATRTRVFDHLWFLWFLCWLVVAFAVYAKVADAVNFRGLPAWLVTPPVCLLWLIPLTFLPQWFMARFGPDLSVGWLPVPHILGYYAIFYFFGALYFDCKDDENKEQPAKLGHLWWLSLPFALLVLFPIGYELFDLKKDAFGIQGLLSKCFGTPDGGFSDKVLRAIGIFVQALYVWTMTFGMMGLFRRLLQRESRAARYLSDASYWLYLTHLPTLFFVQFWLTSVSLPAIVKCTLSVVVVTGFLLVLYQLFVRYTWLGRLLNGPRTRPANGNELTDTATGPATSDVPDVAPAEV